MFMFRMNRMFQYGEYKKQRDALWSRWQTVIFLCFLWGERWSRRGGKCYQVSYSRYGRKVNKVLGLCRCENRDNDKMGGGYKENGRKQVKKIRDRVTVVEMAEVFGFWDLCQPENSPTTGR